MSQEEPPEASPQQNQPETEASEISEDERLSMGEALERALGRGAVKSTHEGDLEIVEPAEEPEADSSID